jgi:hypothetical protein
VQGKWLQARIFNARKLSSFAWGLDVQSLLIHCAMQQERTHGNATARKTVLIVGNPALSLKGFDVAIEVLMLVNEVLPITVTWICQTAPNPDVLTGLKSCKMPIKLYISPRQVCFRLRFTFLLTVYQILVCYVSILLRSKRDVSLLSVVCAIASFRQLFVAAHLGSWGYPIKSDFALLLCS